MKLSVVIPLFDLAAELDRTLAGLAAQPDVMDDFEVIVVDLNSRIDSLEPVHRRYRDRLPVFLVHLPRLRTRYSLSLGRNTGIRFSRNEWVLCLDADCIPGPSYFPCLRKHLEAYPESPVILSAERIFVDAREVPADTIAADAHSLSQAPLTASASNHGLVEDRRMTRLRQLGDRIPISHPWDVMHGCNVIFRREDALTIGGYDESFDGYWGYEDIDFAHRMITDRGCVPVYAEGCHVYHQERSGPDMWRDVRSQRDGNPNWGRIRDRIDGYADHKASLHRPDHPASTWPPPKGPHRS
ncbi:glycosyltransferase [Actinoplanes sp. NPDC026670]|uniref:glycosyltransferase family 2 protein n=1 Tax=Actinoplanes sp. NPDC026670 TaxID=3154700 RepID=UPI0033C7ED5B